MSAILKAEMSNVLKMISNTLQREMLDMLEKRCFNILMRDERDNILQKTCLTYLKDRSLIYSREICNIFKRDAKYVQKRNI
jgi:hypothetical protein